MDPLRLITNILVLSYLAPLLLFVVLYGTRSPWTENELGVALMAQKVGFSLIMLLSVAYLWFGDFFGRSWIALVIYAAVAALLWLDVVNLVRYQKGLPAKRAQYKMGPKYIWRKLIGNQKRP